MDRDTTIILIYLALVLVLGFFTARSSNNREKIHSGPISQVMNYIASCLIVSLPLGILTFVFFLHPPLIEIAGIWFSPIIVLLAGVLASEFVVLMMYALLERPALEKAQAQRVEEGWTEEDARTSGL